MLQFTEMLSYVQVTLTTPEFGLELSFDLLDPCNSRRCCLSELLPLLGVTVTLDCTLGSPSTCWRFSRFSPASIG